MTSPSPELSAYMTLVRKRMILDARDRGVSLALLNATLVALNLAPYQTTDMVGSVVVTVQFDLTDPTPRPSLPEARTLIRVAIVNSDLNAMQLRQWKGFDLLSFDPATGTLRVQVFLAANRTTATNAQMMALVRSAVSIAAYSSLATLPAITGQTIASFVFAAVDGDDPA